MSALDVLAARRKVLVASLERDADQLTVLTENMDKQRKAIESIDNAATLLTDRGFQREWSDDQLDRMTLSGKG